MLFFGSGFGCTAAEGLEDIAIRLVCLRTYYEQIPHLDLVLTPTGFGIVSNENVAPASADRVKELRKQVKDAYDDAYDAAILTMLGTNWVEIVSGRIHTCSLFITAKDLRTYAGMPDAHRSDLLERLVQIAEAEEYIRRTISTEFYEELLGMIRSNAINDAHFLLVYELKMAIGAWLSGNKNVFRMKVANVINRMESHIDDYPKYKDSEAYKVKHFERYQNGKDDTTYFFG
mgnify:CR=1 FL=1